MKFIHIAAVAALTLAFAGPPALTPAWAQSAPAPIPGADQIAGTWQFTGRFDGEETGSVNFSATFAGDGTFVDQDDYPGRWILSGQAFSMFYPDESELGYVGVLRGGEITGRFQGKSASGDFRMTRRP